MASKRRALLISAAVSAPLIALACSSDRRGDFTPPDAGAEAGPPPNFENDAGDVLPGETQDPVTCEQAAATKSYVGCDYWPTVTPNIVWSIFDYAVVVANTGAKPADVTVTGRGGFSTTASVPPNELRRIYLPWIPELKGPDSDECSSQVPALEGSLVVPQGAFHLVSTSPVIVYQFNAIQYEGAGEGAPQADGGPKDWSLCPANSCQRDAGPFPCLSYTNDASLLLPSTAMTGNYRVMGYKGYPFVPFSYPGSSTAITVTATQANTTVVFTASSTATVLATSPSQDAGASNGVTGVGAGGKTSITLANAGDVVEIVAGKEKDLSGSLVQADKPVQVIHADPCMSIPQGTRACDHLEETVPPAETLGKQYVIARPTGPDGSPVGHFVRIYGNQQGTVLAYTPDKPNDCPQVVNAGEVFDCGVVNGDFRVTSDKEFGVATFLLGASQYGGSDLYGDPSQTSVASVEQFRSKFVFLAPADYPKQFADVVTFEDAQLVLDGQPVTAPWTQIPKTPFGVVRLDLTKSGNNGAHQLTGKRPMSVQVAGYGKATSFQYPAGLNLNLIAPPPQ